MAAARIHPFPRFYEHYLGEHRNPTCRLLHFIGSWLVIGILLTALLARRPLALLAVPIVGYGFAWVGHFFFEKNTPATFRQPWYSLAGDWLLWWQLTTRRRSLSEGG
ncbi:MAG: Mpo1-like protein [Steroidobacteraceae bacterium]